MTTTITAALAALTGAAALSAAPAHASDRPGDVLALSPNMAGYLAQPYEFGYPYTGIGVTFKVPTITKVSSGSYAFADDVAAIGAEHGGGILAGVQESMVYGAVSYQAFAAPGGQFDPYWGVTVNPGDTVKVSISFTPNGLWSTVIADETSHTAEGSDLAAAVAGWDAEVVELRPANPIGPGYLPLAATRPLTFDRATVTNADNQTVPFVADLPPVSIPTTAVMVNTTDTKVIAEPSVPDSDADGFTVRDGTTAPPPMS